jgi:hypothetical protein
MTCVISPAEWASFRRCRRQWDFTARMRQNLEPLAPPPVPDLDRVIRDTLAVYYFPGMWDWDRAVTQPLVLQGLERALASQRERCAGSGTALPWPATLEERVRSLVQRYCAWAPSVDRFSPVLVEAEYEVTVPHPVQAGAGLVTPGGEPVRYCGRVDLLAVDQHDAYWVVRHRLVAGPWLPAGELAGDEEAVAACWAWEQFYLGMAITGTIFNEMRLDPAPDAPDPRVPGPALPRSRYERRSGVPAGLPGWLSRRTNVPGWLSRRANVPGWPSRRASLPADRLVRQHEPSGGGRSIPQHRRMYVQAQAPADPAPARQESGPGFRRTWVRWSREEVDRAGRRLAADAAAMVNPGLAVFPRPSGANCPSCLYFGPCQAMMAGEDPGQMLRSAYRQRPPDRLQEGRLGGGAWGMGRGAAPPRFPPGR